MGIGSRKGFVGAEVVAGGIAVTMRSMISGEEDTLVLDITREQLLEFMHGAMVQQAFPQLSAGEREFLLTGISPVEWTKTFGSVEDAQE